MQELAQTGFERTDIGDWVAIEAVGPTVKEIQPDILVNSTFCSGTYTLWPVLISYGLTASLLCQFCASMWTPEESQKIQEIAKENAPGIKTHALPPGFQVAQGPEAVVEYLKEQIPRVLG